VFSFGFGGYGRLGHGSGITADEAIPREVTVFSQSLSSAITDKNGRQQTITMSVKPVNNQKQIRTIVCGSSFTLCVSMTGLLYHWGKMNSAKGGESTMYPKFLPDTQTMTCSSRLAAGNNAVIVGFNDCAIAWGAPPAGKFGLEGGARSSTIPKYISCIDDMHVMDVSAGYGHVCYVVKERTEEGQQVSPSAESLALTARFNSFPMLSNPNISITATANSGSSSGKTENGKRKRAN
jgi:alpha-tubulin suppressor-like RCC1 family protein